MKHNILLRSAVSMLIVGASLTACTDDIALGDASLDKAASSTATIDTVFTNAEYSRQFLVGIYSKQYYGLPFINGGTWAPHAGNPYAGKWDALTDCWHQFWNGAAVYGQYYTCALTKSVGRSDGLDGPLYSYDKEYQWYMIRAAWLFIQNIDRDDSPLKGTEEAERLKAEARCLMVDAFFQTFMNYGGIPIMDHALELSEATNQFPRNTVEECVNFMVSQLDQAISSPALPWVSSGDINTTAGRWTKAGAMAEKCKILQFAASPMLNSDEPYITCSDELKPLVSYQFNSAAKYPTPEKYNSRQGLWNRLGDACDAFVDSLNSKGYYQLTSADVTSTSESNVAKYRAAYRKGYFYTDSKEILHSVRVMQYDNFSTARYCWHSWYTTSVPRNAYSPTQTYVEKFQWYDGEPFNWTNAAKKTYKSSATEPELEYGTNADGTEKITVKNFITNVVTGAVTRNKKSLHTMFVRGDIPTGARQLTAIYTRDPRLYEECIVNGQNKNLDRTSASVSGYAWELWYNGADGGTGVMTQSNTMFGSGYGYNKYYLGDGTSTGGDNLRDPTQWVALSLADMYLTIAESYLMRKDKNIAKAVYYIDLVRTRVGLPTCEKTWTTASWRTAAGYKAASANDAANPNNINSVYKTINGVTITEFLEELLNERARELGLTNARWFDMIRYKRTDWMTTQPQGLMQRRVVQAGSVFETRDKAWVGADRDNDEGSTQPLFFLCQKKNITGNSRTLWGKTAESDEVRKWLLMPIPEAEINKKYGLVQNPLW